MGHRRRKKPNQNTPPVPPSGSSGVPSHNSESVVSSADKHGVPWKNDWQYYAVTEQIAKDIGSIPYNKLPGASVKLEAIVNGEKSALSYMPQSVCVLRYLTTCGRATERTSGINMAAVQLYTFVRHANSGARNYEAADLMMYILAMRDIYAEYFELKRVIGLAMSYTYTNKNLPDLLIQACGVDPIDLRRNLAQYRGRLNVLAEKINSWAVPKYF